MTTVAYRCGAAKLIFSATTPVRRRGIHPLARAFAPQASGLAAMDTQARLTLSLKESFTILSGYPAQSLHRHILCHIV